MWKITARASPSVSMTYSLFASADSDVADHFIDYTGYGCIVYGSTVCVGIPATSRGQWKNGRFVEGHVEMQLIQTMARILLATAVRGHWKVQTDTCRVRGAVKVQYDGPTLELPLKYAAFMQRDLHNMCERVIGEKNKRCFYSHRHTSITDTERTGGEISIWKRKTRHTPHCPRPGCCFATRRPAPQSITHKPTAQSQACAYVARGRGPH